MTFSRASNYTSLDRKQTMQTFSLQGTVEKLMCSSPKVALVPSIQHLLQKHAARHGTVSQHKDPKMHPHES